MMRSLYALRWVGVGLLLSTLAVWVSACSGSEAVQKPPDERFGHRFEGASPDQRETTAIMPPDTSRAYFYYPAVYDTLHIRPGPFNLDVAASTQKVPVEVLVKGAFPDTCSELDGVEQKRIGHLIDVMLQMRKPRGSVCAAVERPYRFYLMLQGAYEPGAYTLTFNGVPRPFSINNPDESAQ